MFVEFGEIDKVKIVLEHDSKKPKGYAFIEYKEVESATRCTEADRKFEFKGNELKVEIARGNNGLKRKRN